jgi:carbamoyltransferase
VSIVLGLNAYHADSAACIVVDGRLVAAAEEERFRRIKHWAGFPSYAIAYCLREAGVSITAVDHVAVNSDPKANLAKKITFALRRRPELGLVLQRLRTARERVSVPEELAVCFPGQRFRGQVHGVEHHLAHLASCFYAAPFDEAVAVSVDGFGDFASAAWGLGRGQTLSVDERVLFPHSLGIFYQALTQFIGFHGYGDEYKVMGLAPYGEPRFLDAMREIVQLEPGGGFRLNLRFFRHHREKIDYAWSGGAPTVGILYSPELQDLLGQARDPKEPLTQHHKDIARSVQAMYEQAFFHLLNRLHDRYRVARVTIAGGCGMNSVANGKIRQNTPFQDVYVQAAAGDAGGAIGAALVVARRSERVLARSQMTHAYWGPASSDAEVARLLDARKQETARAGCDVRRVDDDAELCRLVVGHIAEGHVVGWFQGRMEWGPRALGNRSILGDPRRADMKDILNLKIKRRESFRPFAPSVLREAVADWFEQDADVPFMMQVFQIREARREQIPAVTHVDGSGRLQTVSADTNPRYHQLISAFAAQTGVPMLLNTSFNENEPVVCRPEEALDCFLRTNMDVLVMENWLLVRDVTAMPQRG